MIIRNIYRRIKIFIENRDINSALLAIKVIVETVMNNSSFNGKVLVSEQLDNFLIHMSAMLDEEDFGSINIYNILPKSADNIVILTSFAGMGGHYQLLKSMYKRGIINNRTVYIITDLFGDGLTTLDVLKDIPEAAAIILTNTGYDTKTKEALKILRSIDFERIFLFTHNQDSVGVAAAYASNKPVYYMHHADHKLALGCTIKKFIHVDLHNTSFYSCRYKYRIRNSFLPLTTSHKIPNVKFPNRNTRIMTVGNSSKFIGLIDGFDYPTLVSSILNQTEVEYHHIGKLDDSIINAILRDPKIDSSRFLYSEYVRDLPNYIETNNIDAFFVSVPISGTLSMIEAMSMSLPLIVYLNRESIYSSGLDWAYETTFKWECLDQLIEMLRNFNQYDIDSERKKSYDHYNLYHNEENFSCIIDVPFLQPDFIQPLAGIVEDDLVAIDEFSDLQFQRDFVFASMQNQLEIYQKKLQNTPESLKLLGNLMA